MILQNATEKGGNLGQHSLTGMGQKYQDLRHAYLQNWH